MEEIEIFQWDKYWADLTFITFFPCSPPHFWFLTHTQKVFLKREQMKVKKGNVFVKESLSKRLFNCRNKLTLWVLRSRSLSDHWFIKEKSIFLSRESFFTLFFSHPFFSLRCSFCQPVRGQTHLFLQDFIVLVSFYSLFIYLPSSGESGVCFLLGLLTLHSRISCCSMQTTFRRTTGGYLFRLLFPSESLKQQGS